MRDSKLKLEDLKDSYTKGGVCTEWGKGIPIPKEREVDSVCERETRGDGEDEDSEDLSLLSSYT